MTISHDTATRFPTTDVTGLDTTTGNRTFSHAGSASAKGAVVVICSNATAAPVTGVTYGGVAMILSVSATDTTEAGSINIYTLTGLASFPTGTQDVVLQGCTTASKWATCATVLCSVESSTKVNAIAKTDTTTSSNPALTVDTSQTSLVYGALHGGASDPASYSPNTGLTGLYSGDYGTRSSKTARRTTETSAGSLLFNFTYATSDDWCNAAVAIEEEPPSPILQQVDAVSTSSGSDVPTLTASLAQVGDTILFVHANNYYTPSVLGTPTGTAVSDWGTVLHTFDGGTNDNHAKVWVGTVTTAGGTVVPNGSGALDEERYASILVLDGAWEFDTAASTDSDASATDHVAPSVTPTSGKTDDVLYCLFGTRGTILNYTLPAALTPYTERDTGFNTYRAGSEVLTSDAATGTRTATASVTGEWFALSVLMKTAGGAINLVVADAAQAQSADNVTITQVHTLVINDVAQAQSVDNVTITQVHSLTVQDASQAQSADSVTITQVYTLVINDAVQAQAADNVILTQVHSLVINDAAQAQTVDNVTITQVHTLVINDAAQAQSADNVVLTQVHILTVQDAHHDQFADNVTLTVGGVALVVQEASQVQTVDNVILTQVHSLVVQDSHQDQLADNVILTQVHSLIIQDAAQAQSVDSPVLTQLHTLAVADAFQDQLVDNVVLGIPPPPRKMLIVLQSNQAFA